MNDTPVKIFLVEDDPDEQELFLTFLGNRGDIVLTEMASSGLALIEALARPGMDAFWPDLIILDQNMPLFNGLQTLQRLKATESVRHLPVVVFSTYVDPALNSRCLSAGALSVVTKPLTAAGYQQMMDDFLALLP